MYYNQIRAWSGPEFDRNKPYWGAEGGPGLGWKNQNIVKVGIAHCISTPRSPLTCRLGLNYGESPIPNSRTNNSNSTPATTKYHATAGMTWCRSSCQEWSLCYVASIKGSVYGTDQSIPVSAGGGISDLSSLLHVLQISCGYKW
ncbi:MAG: hypothetical protein H7A37_02530 [Chlamydiales bacterium]|nr:hypothetical protein [Chlamydiales bacterium]